jgi:tRNA modification GTPase
MTDYDPAGSDTIAAISTAPGEAGIGIVRLSGPDAVKMAEKIFHSPKGKRLLSHRVVYGFVRDPETGADIDEVLLTVMLAPGTYTREDVVEISCHGGLVPIRRVLEITLAHGARLAEPGEFTKRAFLNGRIDLSQAEAALDIIRARTGEAERLALEQLRGSLSDKINLLMDRVLGVCAHVEAHIDFPEEEIEPETLDEVKADIASAAEELYALADSYEEGRFFREGLKTAIVGRPNVGKSSLLNALLNRERAIVTETPGTTRDTIEEHLNINGLPVRIVDTAGIREAHGMAEREGVKRSLKAIEDADLVLGLVDGSAPLNAEDTGMIERLRHRSSIMVLNKKDLPQETLDLSGCGLPIISISAKTGEGLDALKRMVFDSCTGGAGRAEGVVVTNLRHKTALEAALRALEAAGGIIHREPLEITAVELRDALDSLGRIVGAVTTDDILEKIFNDFCIGK